jgi:uncharacterized membrane protein
MQTNNNAFVISYLNLRIALGFVGFFLPIILVLGTWGFADCIQLQPSISHYYYTIMGNYFVGSLCAVAMFLFFYKGFEKIDSIVANFAAVFALLVAFFPTDPSTISTCTFISTSRTGSVNYIHYAAAGLLFSSFAYFSLVLFTKTDPTKMMTHQKKMRNNVYKTCGIIILMCILLIAIYNFVPGLISKFSAYTPTLVLESLALFAFGISWIAKGEMFLKDN